MVKSGSSLFRGKVSVEMAVQKLKHYCGYQERCHNEVRQKLYTLGLGKKEVEDVTVKLIEEGYLNEERFARQFASGKSRIKGWGRKKIQLELRQKGISEYCIDLALKTLDNKEYESVFQRAATKKWEMLKREKNIFVRKNKLRLWLLQKGFESSLIENWKAND